MADALRCPRDRTDLAIVRSPGWRTYRCGRCEGVAVTLAALRKIVPEERLRDLWKLLPAAGAGDPCPVCSKPLTGTRVAQGADVIDLDACRSCQLIWFDADELRRFSPARQEPPASVAGHRPNADLSARAREALARATLEAGALGDEALRQAAVAAAVLVFIARVLLRLRW